MSVSPFNIASVLSDQALGETVASPWGQIHLHTSSLWKHKCCKPATAHGNSPTTRGEANTDDGKRSSQSIEVIFQFNNFPVDVYRPVIDQITQGSLHKCTHLKQHGSLRCSEINLFNSMSFQTTERKCRHCKDGWLYYQSSYYKFIFNGAAGWRTWSDSNNFCRNRGSHLVIIDTVEEQVRHEKLNSSKIILRSCQIVI